MKTITIELTEKEAHAVGYALNTASRDLGAVIRARKHDDAHAQTLRVLLESVSDKLEAAGTAAGIA